MSTPSTGDRRPRRTQEERRNATRQALLDAALACLLEDGYAGLTTRRVAGRAGVSAATQRFYFPTRRAFVEGAVEQLVAELLDEQRGHIAALGRVDAGERLTAWLDTLWLMGSGPAFHVVIELCCAARTDEDARECFAIADRALTRQIAIYASELFADEMQSPRFRSLIDLATASIRGLVMFGPVTDRDQLVQRWHAIRDELARLHDLSG